MTQEALKLALEALEYWDVHGKLHQPTEEAITTIKEALAQTQEPVCDKDPQGCWFVRCHLGNKCKHTPPQRTWVGLTLDEIALLHANYPNPQGFALALQAKLKEKNT